MKLVRWAAITEWLSPVQIQYQKFSINTKTTFSACAFMCTGTNSIESTSVGLDWARDSKSIEERILGTKFTPWSSDKANEGK